MEAIAILPFLLTVIVPFILMFVVYAGLIALVIWFIVSFMKTQKERNQILKDISTKMDSYVMAGESTYAAKSESFSDKKEENEITAYSAENEANTNDSVETNEETKEEVLEKTEEELEEKFTEGATVESKETLPEEEKESSHKSTDL